MGRRCGAMGRLPCSGSLLALVVLLYPLVEAYTDPNDLVTLIKLRDATKWPEMRRQWRCGTGVANSVASLRADPSKCLKDPCTDWEYVECKDPTAPGRVTHLHMSDTKLVGAIPWGNFCQFKSLVELDLDGNPQLTGSIPNWFITCFHQIEELDLSRTRLSGELPPSLFMSDSIKELEFEMTYINGKLPPCRSPTLEALELFGTKPGLKSPVPESYKVAQASNGGASWILHSNLYDKSGICVEPENGAGAKKTSGNGAGQTENGGGKATYNTGIP